MKHRHNMRKKGSDKSRMNTQEQQQDMTVQPVEPETAPEEAQQEAPAQEEALQKELESANARADEYLALAQRVQADFDNFRRRNESVRTDAYAEGQRAVATVMLPVLDNLERAVDAAASSAEDDPLRSGVELTLRQLRDTLTKLDVTEINRPGERFDPNLENAILQGTPEEGEPGTVCMVLQKGYRMGKTILRHAMVKVVPD